MNTITSRRHTGDNGNTNTSPSQPSRQEAISNGTTAGKAKQRCTEVRTSMNGDTCNYNADPLSLSNHLSLSSPITKLFQSLNVELQPLQDEEVRKIKRWGSPLRSSRHMRRSQSEGTNVHAPHSPHKRSSSLDNISHDDTDIGIPCEPISQHRDYYKSFETKFSAHQDGKEKSSGIRMARSKKYARTIREAPSVDADDDITVTASGSCQNITKRSQSLEVVGSTDEYFIIAGEISSLVDEIARTEARLGDLKRRKQELERILKGNFHAQYSQPSLYTSAPTLPGEINMVHVPSRRRRRNKSFEAGPGTRTNDGDLFEKTIEAANCTQNRALWRERKVDEDMFSLLHLWESIEIGGEKDDSTSSPNQSQIYNSNMPERKQPFPRSA